MLPQGFLDRVKVQLGTEYDAFLQSLERPRAVALRFRPKEQRALPFLGEPVPWEKLGYYYDPDARPGLHPFQDVYKRQAVKGYYARFLQALPTLKDLSRVDDGALNKLWEGLGYYSRARNLKKAAVEICTNRGGQFPDTYEGVLSLPGVGEYTAGAV